MVYSKYRIRVKQIIYYEIKHIKEKLMAIKELVRMGNPILRLTSTPVAIEDIQTQEMKSLLTDMYDTMKENGGIGIAAP